MLVSMQIEIERACSRLILLYAQAIDEGNVELAVGCYTEDAARRIGNRSAHGREQIQDTLDAAMRNRVSCHVISNIVIDVLSETRAVGTSYLTLWRAPGKIVLGRPLMRRAPSGISRQQDEFVLTSAGWKFAARNSDQIFSAFTEGQLPPSGSLV